MAKYAGGTRPRGVCHSEVLTKANLIWGWQMPNHIRQMERVLMNVAAALTVDIAASRAQVAPD